MPSLVFRNDSKIRNVQARWYALRHNARIGAHVINLGAVKRLIMGIPPSDALQFL